MIEPPILVQGDCRDILPKLDPVDTVFTSPPYFQKRKYGNSQVEVGKENKVDTYIRNLVDIFRSINLHHNGSLWVNIGDKRRRDGGLSLIPERFLIAMQDEGWTVADEVIWAKVVDLVDGRTIGNCMPDPITSRLNGNGFEYLYRFVKGPVKWAWTDTYAIRIPHVQGKGSVRYSDQLRTETDITGRSCHNVWQINMGQSKSDHFAVFPEELCERPIAMTCPPKVCQVCGHVPVRQVEMVPYNEGRGVRSFGKVRGVDSGRNDTGRQYVPKYPKTLGWNDCSHAAYKPGWVLDPFMGTGATGKTALRLGRNFIGIDLYGQYIDIARKNLSEYSQEQR